MQLNNFQAVSPPAIQTPLPESDTGHPRRSSYASMSDMQEQFSAAGLETDQVWESIKAEYKVESRSHLTGMQWATIAAQLNSARRDAHMFKIFVDGIPDSYFRIHVFTDDPSVAIGRPRNINHHHIAAEWGDFQAIATENQCNLTVTQGKRTTFFEAKQTRQPAPENQPAQKTAIALDTNARGQVLNVFGDVVMEVQSHDALIVEIVEIQWRERTR